jgi:hypothetical protein
LIGEWRGGEVLVSSEMINQLGLNLLSILVPALVAMGIAFLKRKLDTATYDKIKSQLETKSGLAWIAVTFAEQAYKDLSGEERYNKAAEWLAAEAQALGLVLTADQIKGLVESAVKLMNDSIQKQA